MRTGVLALVAALGAARSVDAQRRAFRPDDLFRIERVGAISWSPQGDRATVELRRPSRWIDQGASTAAIAVVDATTGEVRTIASPSGRYVGYFGARWSPDGRRIAFLSLDTVAIVRPWVWTVGTPAPAALRRLQAHYDLADAAAVMWSGNDHLIMLARDSTAPAAGSYFVRLMQGRNVVDAWRVAHDGRMAAVSVLDSRGADSVSAPTKLLSIDVRTGRATTLAQGALHRARISAEGRSVTFNTEVPVFAAAPIETFFGPEAQGEAAYDRLNWGGDVRSVDARTGAPVERDTTSAPRWAGRGVALRVVNDAATGTTLQLQRTGRPDTTVWRGNAWMRDVDVGHSERISYTGTDGRSLLGWLLWPPGHAAAARLPIVTLVYPGFVYRETEPSDLSVFGDFYLAPHVFAALGYGVLLPSMPSPPRPLQARAMDSLLNGILPLLDTIVARGIADPDRIAIAGQSAGGWATLGLITQTTRFRSAIATASYANLTSLYGTLYGQYRHGDSGDPKRAQVLRMLQLERGSYGAGAPPWESPDRYRENSPIERVAAVRTPLMLIHGDLDFIPIQQAEEMFTALYRQGKHVRLVRYAGEGHTINDRANVLDAWRQIERWLRETMAPR